MMFWGYGHLLNTFAPSRNATRRTHPAHSRTSSKNPSTHLFVLIIFCSFRFFRSFVAAAASANYIVPFLLWSPTWSPFFRFVSCTFAANLRTLSRPSFHPSFLQNNGFKIIGKQFRANEAKHFSSIAL